MKKKLFFPDSIWSGVKKTLLVMKLTCFLLFITALSYATGTYSQNTRFDINVEDASVVQVLEEIEQLTDFGFLFKTDLLDVKERFTLNLKQTKIDKVMKEILDSDAYSYKIMDKIIVISRKGSGFPEAGDQSVISGKVTDVRGESLPGVSIAVKGTSGGTITNEDGNYSLSNVGGDATLVFSFVGMRTQEVPVQGRKVINVIMQEESIGLEEVVAVGYGTQKKANLTGAVAAISGEELENRPLPNVGEVLRGVSPNLNISLSGHGGEPGSGRNWNIRGLGSINGDDSPLILIDGVESDINDLDPGNIEGVSVLKDASASAIYGSRAPFGVVLITTKKGRKGEPIHVQYSNNVAFNSMLGVAHMKNSLIFATAYNQASENAGSPPVFPDEQVERIKGFIDGTFPYEYDPDNPPNSIWAGRRVGNANYDWPYELMKNFKVDQKHNVSLRGGSEKSQYYISMGYYDENGFYSVGYDDYKRYDILINFSSEVTNWMTFDLSAKYANSHTDYPLGITTVERRYFFTNLYVFDNSANTILMVVRPILCYVQ